MLLLKGIIYLHALAIGLLKIFALCTHHNVYKKGEAILYIVILSLYISNTVNICKLNNRWQ